MTADDRVTNMRSHHVIGKAPSFWALLGLAVVVTLSSVAAEPPKLEDPGFGEDVQDVLFLSSSRPVLIRLHVRVDGKPYATLWTEYVTHWFRFLDRDANGFLDPTEAARAPAVPVLQNLLSNPSATYQFIGAPAFENFDRDHDKKISLAEMMLFYRQSAAGPAQLISGFNQMVQGTNQDALTDALFDALDTNKDGKLSEAEVASADKSLYKYDQNDDELIAVHEILPANPATLRPGAPPSLTPSMQAPDLPLLLVPREDAPRRLKARLPVARRVLEHYDKNKNKALSRAEIGMPREQFAYLDANHDGELDLFELLRWVIARPDVEVTVRLGRVEDKQLPVEIQGPRHPALRTITPTTLSFTTDLAAINLISAARLPQANAGSIRNIVLQQFKAIDRKERGFVSKKQLHQPNFFYLNSILTVADHDDDECLSLEELNAWLELITSGFNCQISVALAASGRGLFALMDADSDGRLSLREQRGAWPRFASMDRKEKGAIRREDIPWQYQVVVNPGVPNYLAGQLSGFNAPPELRTATRLPTIGPLWFRKMDRNGDGDVSLQEFLGTQADFRRLDTNGDGLISLEEARRADAALRKK
jgi:Ca2+-binding EF-hand superfamily protein